MVMYLLNISFLIQGLTGLAARRTESVAAHLMLTALAAAWKR
jgi:hypothetical protein